MMLLPDVDQTARGVLVLAHLPKLFGSTRQVILTRRHYQHRSGSRTRQGFVEELEILCERVVPSTSFPGNSPAFGLVPTDDSFDNHSRFFNGPFAHGLRAQIGRAHV